MESGVNAGSGVPCSYPQSWGNVPMLHYGVRRSVLVNLDLEVRVCFQQSLLHCPKEPSADSLIPSNQSTTFIQTFISCHLDHCCHSGDNRILNIKNFLCLGFNGICHFVEDVAKLTKCIVRDDGNF